MLCALEGLDIAAPAVQLYVVPAAVAILAALLLVQPPGTSRISTAVGPIMLVRFVVIGALGLCWIVQDPSVLLAINTYYGLH
jgi:KUP system potassium uptake protein